MARSVVASGTQTATINTEHVLRDETANEGEVFDAVIDLGAMVAGDILELRVYVKALAAGTLRRCYYAKYVDTQDSEGLRKSPIVYIPAMTIMKEWKLTLKQTAGTGRAFDWTIYK